MNKAFKILFLLFLVLLSNSSFGRITGNTTAEWQEINNDQTDAGRKSHLVTRGTENAVMTAFFAFVGV